MSRPRILHIGKFYPPHMGGIETHLETLCHELRDRFDLHVAVANHGKVSQREIRGGIPVHRVATPFSLGNAPVNPGLAAAIRETRPDLIHLHLPHPGGVLAVRAAGSRAPLLVTYHSDVVRQWLWSAAFRPFLDDLLRRSEVIIATSPGYLESSAVLQRHLGRCRVVPYGIRIERFASPDSSAVNAIRVRYGPRLMLAVGRLVYYKGFEVLIRALPALDGRLLLIGDGPLRGSLEALASSLGVRHKVVFLGELQNEDTAPFFRAADVFVLPSVARSEAFGIVQLEAMASGTPVINTSLASGVPWVSQHERTGLTVPPDDPAALSRAITALLDDDTARAGLGAAARARVRAEFTVQIMGDRLAAIYEAALGRQPAATAAGASV